MAVGRSIISYGSTIKCNAWLQIPTDLANCCICLPISYTDQRNEIDRSNDNGERDALDFERKSKELEEAKKRKIELENIIGRIEEEIMELQQKGEDYEEKRVKLLSNIYIL